MKRMTVLLLAVATALLTMAIVAGTASAQTYTEEVGSAGTVTFQTEDGVLAFVAATPATGWDFAVVREDGTHLKVVFTDSDGAETEFEAEIEDGQLLVEASDESGITSSTTLVEMADSATSATTSTTLHTDGASTTTIPDDDDDDDDDDDEVRSRVDGFAGVVVLEVGPAGTVTVEGDGERISLLGVAPAGGWDHVVDRSDGAHIEIRFFGSDGTEIEFETQFMGDHLDWRYEVESDDDDDNGNGSTTSTTSPDDDDDDDDGDGDGDGDDDGDGDGDGDDDDDDDGDGDGDDDGDGDGDGDDDDDDDDNSGPGSGSDD